MKKRIKRISVKQSAKVITSIYGLAALIIGVPLVVIQMIATRDVVTSFGILLFLALYLLIAFVGIMLVFTVYNFVAKKFGGIEVELEDVGNPSI